MGLSSFGLKLGNKNILIVLVLVNIGKCHMGNLTTAKMQIYLFSLVVMVSFE